MNEGIDWAQVRERLAISERSREAEATTGHLEALYRQRAIRLASRPPDRNAPRNALLAIVFSLGEEHYAIDAADITEVVRIASITAVPGVDRHFSGVINVRGEIRPVLDLKQVLGIPGDEAGNSGRVLLAHKNGFAIGLKVDRVEQVRSIARQELRVPRDQKTGTSARYLQGITPDTLMLLNTEALFTDFSKENTRS